tara:strand:+ start:314 stop:502 length:189 start_codon:yes stop_codon:yes gene_type:complete
MPEKSTYTDDLSDILPELINQLNNKDEKIELLNKLLEEREIDNIMLIEKIEELQSYINSVNF